jgi:predicted TPR repeat methyltransferase
LKTIGDAFAEALSAYEQGQLETARRLAKRLAAKQPGFGGAPYLLGLIAGDLGQHPQAVHHLTKAVALSPAEPVPRLALGGALEAAGLPDRAVAQYRAALELDPDLAEANARLGAQLLAQGDTAEAARHFKKALEVHDDWAAVLNNLGLAEGRLGDQAQAAGYLRRAVAAQPDHMGFRINLANALLALKDYDGALAETGAVNRADPGYEDGWITLGLINQAMGRWGEAAQAFASALDIDPNLVSPRWCLAEALRHLGHNEDASAHYEICLMLDPEDRHGARLGLALTLGEEAQGEAPDKAPEAYVRQLFDDFAADFDRRLVEGLDYRAPALLGERLAPLLGEPHDLKVIDLGCGTGLAAPVLKPWAARLDGIDLSASMLDKARARGLYDQLTEGDICAVADRVGQYDLAVAADVLVYLGDLEPLFAAVHRALAQGGRFALTVEHGSKDDGWSLGEKSRYAHGEGYVRALAERTGFTVTCLDHASTRSDAGMPVPGLVVILDKR